MHAPWLSWERALLRPHYSYYHVAYNARHTTCIAYMHWHPFDSFQNAHKRTACPTYRHTKNIACPTHRHQKNQSQIKGDQLDPPVVIWVLKNNVTSQQELDVGRPVSLVKHQVRVVWGFHTPAQRSRQHPLTSPVLHEPTELPIPVLISFFSFSPFCLGYLQVVRPKTATESKLLQRFFLRHLQDRL